MLNHLTRETSLMRMSELRTFNQNECVAKPVDGPLGQHLVQYHLPSGYNNAGVAFMEPTIGPIIRTDYPQLVLVKIGS